MVSQRVSRNSRVTRKVPQFDCISSHRIARSGAQSAG